MRLINIISLIIVFFLNSTALSADCEKAVGLYNRAAVNPDLVYKEKLYREALNAYCEDRGILAKVHNNLADTYERQKRLEKAVEEYKKAIELDPELATPYISLGDVYSRMGEFKSAGAYYDKYWKLTSFKSREQIRSSLSLRSPERAIKPAPSEVLYFDFDVALLTGESERQLEELHAALQDDELRSYKFLLAGHTCSIGSDAYNQKLSERRAEAVKKWLVGHGHPLSRLETMGFGEERPYADNGTEEGRKLNRRVEIKTIGIMNGNQDDDFNIKNLSK
ncbi:MAG: OmpA family protein [Nitrospirota bacterium]